MEDMTLCSPHQREVFRRVWARVMSGREDQACPPDPDAVEELAARMEGDLSCACLESLAGPTGGSPDPLHRGSDLCELADAREEGCTTHLRRYVLDSLEGWQFYRHLARRTRGNPARVISRLAAETHQQARRLSAAYFLMTGLRYWPSETLGVPVISSLWGAMRRRHQEEQQAEEAFRMAAQSAAEDSLRELYLQLAEGCRSRRRQLQSLLEQSCP